MLLLFAIKYDFFQKRTLMNKLFSSFCWYCLITVPIMQSMTLWRYTVGPLCRTTCILQTAFMNIVKWQCLLIVDSILLSRYVFVFWLKNPSAMDDDFWDQYCKKKLAAKKILALLSAAQGQRPKNYLSCSCWIFHFA